MIDELEKMANLNIPKDLASNEANSYLIDACAKFDIKCPPPQTTARLLDKVSYVYNILFSRQIISFAPFTAAPNFGLLVYWKV